MKGPQGLASESCERRCQTANGRRRWVRGCFYVRSPEITDSSGGNGAGSGEPRMRRWPLRVTPDSDVTRKAKDMANAGSPVAAGVVPGARPGKPGDSNAAGWECGPSRSRPGGRAMSPAGQWGLVRSPRVVPGVDDERADGSSNRSNAPPAGSGWSLGRRRRRRGGLREEPSPDAADRRRAPDVRTPHRVPPTVFWCGAVWIGRGELKECSSPPCWPRTGGRCSRDSAFEGFVP